MFTLILTSDSKGGIARRGELPIRNPVDMKFFRDMTLNQVVIMGRKTRDSLPLGYLPRRINVVMSREEGCRNVEECKAMMKSHKDKRWFVIGGSEIYHSFLEAGCVNHILYTFINQDLGCDTFVGFTPSSLIEDGWLMAELTERERELVNDTDSTFHMTYYHFYKNL
jgi:dihydrofolate reductase